MTDDDRTLIRSLRSGDESALEALLERHWEGLLLYSHTLVGDWDGAEDVAQHVFVQLWARRERWSEDSSTSLLFRIARNRALDVARRKRLAADHRASDRRPVGASAEGPDRMLEAMELEDSARAAVAALPPRRREVFRLVREQGLSYGEVAEVLGLSPQTVANHMSMALADLRAALRPLFPELDAGGVEAERRTQSDSSEESR